MNRVLDLRRTVVWLRGCLRWRGLSLAGLSIVDAFATVLVGLHQREAPALDTYWRPLLRALGLGPQPERTHEPFRMRVEKHGKRKTWSAGCVRTENVDQWVRGWREMGLIAKTPALEGETA